MSSGDGVVASFSRDSRLLGFAVVAHQPGSDGVAVWLTSFTPPASVEHTNAYLHDVEDPDSRDRIGAMIAHRVLIATEGTSLVWLPTDGAWDLSGVHQIFVDAVLSLQRRIDSAFETLMQNDPGRPLVPPDFLPEPILTPLPIGESSTDSALHVANHVKRLWSWWLDTESHRRARAKTLVKVDRDLAGPLRPYPPEWG